MQEGVFTDYGLPTAFYNWMLFKMNDGREAVEQTIDRARSEHAQVGGIDLNPTMLGLEQRGDAVGFTVDNAMLQNIQPNSVQGIRPVIINIVPITNYMPLFSKAENVEEFDFSQI